MMITHETPIVARSRKSLAPPLALPLVNLVFLLLGFFLVAGSVQAPLSVTLAVGEGEEIAPQPVLFLTKEGAFLYEKAGVRRTLTMEEAVFHWKEKSINPLFAADAAAPAAALALFLNRLQKEGVHALPLLVRAE